MSRHESVWLATAHRPSFPSLDGDTGADVAVLGAGVTGLTTALLLQREGARVMVVEADRIAGGTTGHTTGKVTSQHSICYRPMIERHGEHRARLYADANQHAIELVAELVEASGEDCGFQRAPAWIYTLNPEYVEQIEAEHAAARRLGLPATLSSDIDLPFPVAGALRFDDQAHIHAGRYMAALARSFVAAGGRIVEHTRVTGVDELPDHATVRTPTGEIRATHVVVATLLPFLDRGGFFAKARPSRSYGVAARLSDAPPAGMHISIDDETRSTRPWYDGDRPGLIVVGSAHPTGGDEASPGCWGDLEVWTRRHFDVESFEYRWSAQDYITIDEMPYVGLSPLTTRTFVATGFKKWGLTNGTAAGRILADMIGGKPSAWSDVFDTARIGGAEGVKQLLEENLGVAREFVVGRLSRLRAEAVSHLHRGDGGLADIEGTTVGAYRDPTGALHAVSATCTHMGCTVHWNGAENSWDCPCHGSRFATDGSVLEGPALHPLQQIEVESGETS